MSEDRRMTNYEKVKEWITEEMCPWGSYQKYVNEVELDTPDRHRFEIYTDNRKYSIDVAEPRGEYDEGYLGCVSSLRKMRAGETWHRGNDLPDGPCTQYTFEEIKRAIIMYELVALEPKVKPICDKTIDNIGPSTGE